MMVPTTTAEAWLTPRSRESSGREAARGIASAMLELEYTRGRKTLAAKFLRPPLFLADYIRHQRERHFQRAHPIISAVPHPHPDGLRVHRHNQRLPHAEQAALIIGTLLIGGLRWRI